MVNDVSKGYRSAFLFWVKHSLRSFGHVGSSYVPADATLRHRHANAWF